MSRFRNSIDLAKSSWAVLQADKELLWLPVISGIASIAVAITFFVPSAILTSTDGGLKPVGFVGLLLGYVALAYTTIFFNAALVHAADERMRGGDPDLRSAINGAKRRWRQILPWAIVSATVSMIVRAIEERAGIVGRIIGGLIGMAWSLVTFLVLPILVVEGLSVGDAIRRSTEMFKRTWGEQVVANAGIGLVSFLAMIPGILVALLGFASGSVVVAVPLVVIAALYLVAVISVSSALSGVFQTALYHYAANGMPPAAFANVDLGGAFVAKRGR